VVQTERLSTSTKIRGWRESTGQDPVLLVLQPNRQAITTNKQGLCGSSAAGKPLVQRQPCVCLTCRHTTSSMSGSTMSPFARRCTSRQPFISNQVSGDA
jgi:hypothetical protein